MSALSMFDFSNKACNKAEIYLKAVNKLLTSNQLHKYVKSICLQFPLPLFFNEVLRNCFLSVHGCQVVYQTKLVQAGTPVQLQLFEDIAIPVPVNVVIVHAQILKIHAVTIFNEGIKTCR